MLAGHTQGGDEHGDAAQEEDGAGDREEASHQDKPVLVKEQDESPDHQQHQAGHLTQLKGPGNVRQVVLTYEQKFIFLSANNQLKRPVINYCT